MKFSIIPSIEEFDRLEDFLEIYDIKEDDLVFTSKTVYNEFLKDIKSHVYFYMDYGLGEPTDILVEKLYSDIKDISYNRVFAIGGGAIIDVGKLLALKEISPVVDLFEGKIKPVKNHELIVIPTTCGTGSEVTNISILSLTTRNTKFGLAVKEIFPDKAVLIPLLLEKLPYKVFATSSMDALIHAFESFVSPNASIYSKMYAKEAIKLILNGYIYIKDNGIDSYKDKLKDFLIGSNYAGISFSNAGCGLVHAMSYPLGSKYHVAHGESNYCIFMAVFKKYMELAPIGVINELNEIASNILGVEEKSLYKELEILFNSIIPLKKMNEYGVVFDDLEQFCDVVIEKQTRLTKNNYTKVDRKTILDIYKSVF